MIEDNRKLLVLGGLTAAGKSAFSFRLRERFPIRLISSDSMQVYRGLDIGTAKVPRALRSQLSMIDIVDPGQGYSAGLYAKAARRECELAWQRLETPCVVGGTGLYIRALVDGLNEVPPSSPELKREIEALSLPERIGRLKSLDPESLGAIDLKNPRRVGRALEIVLVSGKTRKEALKEFEASAIAASSLRLFCLAYPSSETAAKVHERHLQAMKAGWLEEVQGLAKAFGEEKIRSIGAIGYATLLDRLDGKIDEKGANELIETQTRQYARRQRTWFQSDKRFIWTEDPDALFAATEAYLRS